MIDIKTYNRIRNMGRREGKNAEKERIKNLLRDPPNELISLVATCIQDSKLGPARAAIDAICNWIK